MQSPFRTKLNNVVNIWLERLMTGELVGQTWKCQQKTKRGWHCDNTKI